MAVRVAATRSGASTPPPAPCPRTSSPRGRAGRSRTTPASPTGVGTTVGRALAAVFSTRLAGDAPRCLRPRLEPLVGQRRTAVDALAVAAGVDARECLGELRAVLGQRLDAGGLAVGVAERRTGISRVDIRTKARRRAAALGFKGRNGLVAPAEQLLEPLSGHFGVHRLSSS